MTLQRERFRWVVGILAAATALVFAASPRLHGQDLAKLDTSLKLIPADAAHYSAMLRNREQIEAIANSKAWKKLTSLPLAKMAWQKVEDEYNQGQLNPLKQWYDLPENRQLVAVLKDLVSEEIFFSAGKSAIDFV